MDLEHSLKTLFYDIMRILFLIMLFIFFKLKLLTFSYKAMYPLFLTNPKVSWYLKLSYSTENDFLDTIKYFYI